MSYRHSTVRLAPDQHARVEAIAKREGRTSAEIIRRAVEDYLGSLSRGAEQDLRHHRISEFSQIALDQIIRREHPDLVDAIVSETNRRMERHHGAR